MSIDLNQIVDVTLTKAFKVAYDEEAKKAGDFRNCFAKVRFRGLTLLQVFQLAMKPIVIAKQTSCRKHWDKFSDGQTFEINAVAPGKAPEVHPYDGIIALAKAANMTVEEYMKAEAAKRQAPKVEPLT